MKLFQAIKTIFSIRKNKAAVPTTEPKNNFRVFTPPGYIAFFFKNVCIVATNERKARRQYEIMLRKEIKLQMGTKND